MPIALSPDTDPRQLPPETKAKWVQESKGALIDILADTEVSGNLDLSFPDLKRLPENLRVLGHVAVNMSQIEEIPASLSSRGISADGCRNLKAIRANNISGDVLIGDCPLLEELPLDFYVNGNLHIANCPRLKRIPNGLVVTGNMYLENLENLLSIGKHSLVIGDILFESCPKLRTPPSDLRNTGTLSIIKCPHIDQDKLPAKVTLRKDPPPRILFRL